MLLDFVEVEREDPLPTHKKISHKKIEVITCAAFGGFFFFKIVQKKETKKCLCMCVCFVCWPLADMIEVTCQSTSRFRLVVVRSTRLKRRKKQKKNNQYGPLLFFFLGSAESNLFFPQCDIPPSKEHQGCHSDVFAPAIGLPLGGAAATTCCGCCGDAV